MKKLVALAAGAALVCVGVSANAGLLNDLKKLAGMGVIAAGDVRAEDCPSSTRYDCARWPSNIYSVEGNACFELVGRSTCGSSCQGILAVNQQREVYFFAKDSVGDGYTQSLARRVECPLAY